MKNNRTPAEVYGEIRRHWKAKICATHRSYSYLEQKLSIARTTKNAPEVERLIRIMNTHQEIIRRLYATLLDFNAEIRPSKHRKKQRPRKPWLATGTGQVPGSSEDPCWPDIKKDLEKKMRHDYE